MKNFKHTKKIYIPLMLILIGLVIGGYYVKNKGLLEAPPKLPSISSAIPAKIYLGMPDKLSVNRSVNPLGQANKNPTSFYKEINDLVVVQNLYKAILNLPIHPTSQTNAVTHCVNNASLALYELNFFKNNNLVQKGTMNIVGCGGGMTISLEGDYEREFYDHNSYGPFMLLLEKSFGVTSEELYGR